MDNLYKHVVLLNSSYYSECTPILDEYTDCVANTICPLCKQYLIYVEKARCLKDGHFCGLIWNLSDGLEWKMFIQRLKDIPKEVFESTNALLKQFLMHKACFESYKLLPDNSIFKRKNKSLFIQNEKFHY